MGPVLSVCKGSWGPSVVKAYFAIFVFSLLYQLMYPLPGSYGSTLRYKSVERIKPIGKHSLLGASGEISDFQEILQNLDELMYVLLN